LSAFLYYLNYTKELKTLDETIFSQMRVCSYDLKCDNFAFDFIDKKERELYTLLQTDKGVQAFFPVSGSVSYVMALSLDKDAYQKQIAELQKDLFLEYLMVFGAIFVLSLLFSLYALYPLRNALLLTQEFIKDILHDFNTPLATLRLNIAMLKREYGGSPKIERVENSVQHILDLQENLRAYLHNHEMQKEILEVRALMLERIALIEKSYADITFSVTMELTHITTSRDAFVRIIDNLLSNASKYNKVNGFVKISYEVANECLVIEDSGKGIENPSRIFDRFYKEQERGIGIGLHIVKKLCDELHIGIGVSSVVGEGSRFTLTLR